MFCNGVHYVSDAFREGNPRKECVNGLLCGDVVMKSDEYFVHCGDKLCLMFHVGNEKGSCQKVVFDAGYKEHKEIGHCPLTWKSWSCPVKMDNNGTEIGVLQDIEIPVHVQNRISENDIEIYWNNTEVDAINKDMQLKDKVVARAVKSRRMTALCQKRNDSAVASRTDAKVVKNKASNDERTNKVKLVNTSCKERENSHTKLVKNGILDEDKENTLHDANGDFESNGFVAKKLLSASDGNNDKQRGVLAAQFDNKKNTEIVVLNRSCVMKYASSNGIRHVKYLKNMTLSEVGNFGRRDANGMMVIKSWKDVKGKKMEPKGRNTTIGKFGKRRLCENKVGCHGNRFYV
jgi:hypothetical protein